MMADLARVLVVLGVALAGLGVVLLAADRLGLGRLPGDLDLSIGPVRVWIPVVTSVVLSVLATIALNLWIRR